MGEWAQIGQIWRWSGRERDVVRMLATGMSRKRAAHKLGISPSTLQTHLRRALWKAKADDLISLIWMVVAELQVLRQ